MLSLVFCQFHHGIVERFNVPKLIHQSGGHCRRWATTARCAGKPGTPAEIVIRHMQRNRRVQVGELLGESQGQPSEPLRIGDLIKPVFEFVWVEAGLGNSTWEEPCQIQLASDF